MNAAQLKRLEMIKALQDEQGNPDGDKGWLIYRLGMEAVRCRGLQAKIRGLRDQVARWLT
jgi:hypothetical protein